MDNEKFTDSFRFSASSLKTFLQCGQKFKYEKVDKLKADVEVGHARWLGKIAHASIYSAVAQFKPDEGFKSWELDTHKLADKSAGTDKALKTFEILWNRDVSSDYNKQLYDNEVGSDRPAGRFMTKKKVAALNVDNQTELEANWKEEAKAMVKNGVAALARVSEITKLEYKTEFQYQGKSFSGFVDVLGKNSAGEVIFLDFKTVWDKPSPAKLSDDPQFILYSYALKHLLDLDYYPKGYFVHLKSGASVEFVMDEQIIEKLDEKFKGVVTLIDRNLFFKQPTILCNYCDFQDICQGG